MTQGCYCTISFILNFVKIEIKGLVGLLISLTMACKETRHLGIFPTRDFELSKSCSNLTLLAPNKGGLEVSKKVQYVSVAQWAAKLQLVKLGVIFHKV